ncbi:hypothetical protein [Halobaculum gomorrense]|uniref:Lipoprotein n=1 Tax=Halobaculum gomorrense TaxID=43928 RepID=A0A1M5MWF1_9EURY|nr:hypothetical protein [Halobaculum gomorrense]SHG81535.1 hypothetical protein SAMN05443636_1172 [Halobaculum gomorrense]
MRPRTPPLLACGIALLLVTAGCLGAPGGRADGPTATSSEAYTDASATSVAAAGLPGEPVEWPDGPKTQPDPPATWNESSVGSFARTHEYRYVYNSLWYDESTEVSIECELDGVSRERDAWRAVVTCTASSNTGGDPVENGTATSTVMHADYFTQTWAYWIDGETDTVHRTRADR